MIIIGLTGSIGMGKSTVASLLSDMGYPVYNADKAVHALLRRGGKAVKPVAKLFPSAVKRGEVNRKILGPMVFNHPIKLKKLERILHPLIRHAEKEFLQKARKKKESAAILEIPLLFETNGHKRCDFTICVTAPKTVQMARVMQRPGMTKDKLKAIQARQMPDKRKRKLANYVINTGGSRSQTKQRLQTVLTQILKV